MPRPDSFTCLPPQWTAQHGDALNSVIPFVYEELRRLASRQLARERPNHTLQTTALVHEVYMRLVEQRNIRPADRGHLLAVSARLMRFILVDYARQRRSDKHGGAAPHLSLEDAHGLSVDPQLGLLDLDAALGRLARHDARKADVAEMRLFAGLTVDEIAAVLDVSPATVARDWRFARAWLENELRSGTR